MADSKTKAISVATLIDHFDFVQETGDKEALNRMIRTTEISRPGFELAGFFQHSDMHRIIVFGEKEIAFIAQLDQKTQEERFNGLTHENTPAIIICKSYACPPVLKKIAKKKNFPIFLTERPTGRVSIAISAFLDEQLAEETLMHGVFMNIHGKGVIIRGDSGIGKSEIALELIKRGHLLIADDCVELYHIGSTIIGKSPAVLANLLEIRGIGVIDVVKMFGVSAILDKDVVDLVVQLERWVPSKEYTRIGTEENQLSEDILGVSIPKAIVPVTGGRSMSAVIEAAVMNMRLKELGYDSSKEFVNRILENINKNRQE